MHTDARMLANNTIIEGDICIIGAGAAGISMAMDWIGTPHKVILLEGGGFAYDDKVQELYAGKTTGQRYYPLKSSRLHLFGGTTGHWAGFCAPFDEIDFDIIIFSIYFCVSQCWFGNINRVNFRAGKPFCQCNGNAATSSSDVEYSIVRLFDCSTLSNRRVLRFRDVGSVRFD